MHSFQKLVALNFLRSTIVAPLIKAALERKKKRFTLDMKNILVYVS